MADDLTRRRPEDTQKININQRWELDFWSKKLGVPEERLEQVVKIVGPSVAKVQEYLARPALKRKSR